jgi:hypothetical protein
MSRNGSGGYSLPTNSWNPAVNGVSATPADWQNLINDVATAIQQSVSADGQTPVTGNINMNNNKLTALAAGNATGNSLRWEQLFSQGVEQMLASAATTDIGLQNTSFLQITGTTTITSFGTNYNGPRFIRFAGAVLLTNSASLQLPYGANITTAADDCLIAIPKATSGTPDGWKIVSYQYANQQYMQVQDQKASGTVAGAALAGDNIRVLNTVVTNTIPGASLASSQITLPAGTYDFTADAPAYAATGTVGAILRLRNITDSTNQVLGRSNILLTNTGITAIVSGRFKIDTTKTFSLIQQFTSAQATNGLGAAASFGYAEIYANAEFWKV